MTNPYFIGLIAWLLPGLGHILLGRWKRGLIIAVAIWAMFVIAILSGGAYYPGFGFKDGALLYLLNIFSKIGNGLGAFISFLLGSNPPIDAAAKATFEYGGRFLEISGLLNFIAIMDAIDIRLGRKP
jgi:hypothetical protein